jgi:hypothetical protein
MKFKNALHVFVTRPTWPLTLYGSFMVAFSIVALTAFIEIAYEWRFETIRYATWIQSELPATCAALAAQCEAEAPGSNRNGGVTNQDSHMDQVVVSYVCSKRIGKNRNIECFWSEPGSFQARIMATNLERKIGEPLLIVWLALFLPYSALRVVTGETHRGWRRLAIAIGVFAAPVVGTTTYLFDVVDPGLVWMVALAGLLSGLVLPLIGRRVFLWVKAGFSLTADLSTRPTDRSVDESNELRPPCRLNAKSALKVLGIAVVIFAGVIHLVLDPLKMASTVIESVSQVVVLVIVLALGRWAFSYFGRRRS